LMNGRIRANHYPTWFQVAPAKAKVFFMSTSLPVTGNTERTMPENRAFYPALDGLRAIAFLLVFLAHYYSLPWGWGGVNVFFVLSGFLITGILFDSRNDAHRARNFYVRRTLRIFPLYYGVFLVVLLLEPIFHWQWSFAWLAWPLYLANYLRFVSPSIFTDGSPMQLASLGWLRTPLAPQVTLYLGHFWSLCVEEQFYLIWPWVVFSVRSRRALLWICSIVVVTVPLSRIFAQHHAPDWMLQAGLLNCITPFQLDSLLLGGLVALLVRGAHRKKLFEISVVILIWGTLIAAFILAVGIGHALPNWRGGYAYPSWTYTWGLTFINFISAAVIVCSLQSSTFIFRFLSVRPLRWIGRISYGAYVFHDIFHNVFRAAIAAIGAHIQFVASHTEEFVLVLGLICTLLISWLSFRFFESAFINLKERWTILPSRPVVEEGIQA
jgi:peptidoglycan/LPS O-acetylase OafA/YrhL